MIRTVSLPKLVCDGCVAVGVVVGDAERDARRGTTLERTRDGDVVLLVRELELQAGLEWLDLGVHRA